MSDASRDYLAFLRRVSTGPDAPISPATAERAASLWAALTTASRGKLPVPAAMTGPDGQMFYSWDAGRHHLEAEVVPDRPVEWFYRDRRGESFWGDDADGETIPARVVAMLGAFYPGETEDEP